MKLSELKRRLDKIKTSAEFKSFLPLTRNDIESINIDEQKLSENVDKEILSKLVVCSDREPKSEILRNLIKASNQHEQFAHRVTSSEGDLAVWGSLPQEQPPVQTQATDIKQPEANIASPEDDQSFDILVSVILDTVKPTEDMPMVLQKQIKTFADFKQKELNSLLANTTLPLQEKIKRINNFDGYLHESTFVFNIVNNNEFDLTPLKECYYNYKKQSQLIESELAQEDALFQAMTATKQFEHLKNLAKTIPFEFIKSERNRLLDLLDENQKMALFKAIPEKMRKFELRDPKKNDLTKSLNNALVNCLIEDKWEIWLVQQKLPKYENKSDEKIADVNKFLLLSIKMDILHTDWKVTFKKQKNKIEHSIDGSVKTKHVPEQMAAMYKIIVGCENLAKKAKTTADSDSIWANAVKLVAQLGANAENHKPKSFLGIGGRDPRANLLYQKLGLIHEKIKPIEPFTSNPMTPEVKK